MIVIKPKLGVKVNTLIIAILKSKCQIFVHAIDVLIISPSVNAV